MSFQETTLQAATTKQPKQIVEAELYINQRQIPQTIQLLASLVLFNQPENPREFMIKKLEEMKLARLKNQALPFFSRVDLIAYYRTLDVVGKGYITLAQYSAALNTIGVSNVNKKPKGYFGDMITMETFLEDAYSGQTTL